MSQSTYLLAKRKETNVKMGYYLSLPEGYNKESREQWPLLVFLHGSGERGNGESELLRVKKHGIPKILDGEKNLPFIALSPQCPENSTWVSQIENLNFLVDEIIKAYNIDESRLYLTGMSMGGYGAWLYGMSYPDKFAAIAPLCGGGMAWNAEVLKNVPIWAFHGEEDDAVPFAESLNMVNALKNAGGNVKFTRYPGVGHNCWTETYNNDELYKWFLEQKKY